MYWSLIVVGYAAVVLALFWRVLFRRQVCGWDCLDEYWPDLVFQSRVLGDGELPLWNPYTLGGYAFYADPQAGVLTPVNWVCTVVSWLFGVGPYLIQLKVLLLFYVALLGMHVLVWRWTRNHAASAIAALIFVAGSPMLVHKNSALIWPLLLLPWAMVALDAFRERATIERGIALGLGVGMVAVSHPQGAFYSALIVGVYAGYHALLALVARYRARRETPMQRALLADLRRIAPGLVCAIVIAGMWMATVFVPTWSTVDSSARAGKTVAWALSDPLTTRALRELFVPNLDSNWMHDIYLGPLAVIVVVWLAIVRRDGRLWLALGIVSVLLALGAYGHLLPWLAEHLPGFGLFRIAYRYKLITGFAGAAAVGLGVAALTTTELSRRHHYIFAGALGLWTLGVIALGRTLPPWPAVLVVVALCAAVFDRPVRRRWWQAALVVLVLIDLWRAGDTKLAIMQVRPDPNRGGDLLAQMPGVDHTWRFHANRYSGSGGNLPIPYQAAAVHGVREISGFEQPLVSQRMLDILVAGQKTPALLTHFNTKYFVGVAPTEAARIAGSQIAVAADVAPIARLYPRAEVLRAPEILARLSQLSPSALDAALVEAPLSVAPAAFKPVDGRVLAFERSRLVIEIDAPAAGVLVINEAWSPLWRATIDGTDAALLRANYVLRAVVVPAGTHRIELALDAGAYRGLLLADGVLLVGMVALVVVRRRRRNSSNANASGHSELPRPVEHA